MKYLQYESNSFSGSESFVCVWSQGPSIYDMFGETVSLLDMVDAFGVERQDDGDVVGALSAELVDVHEIESATMFLDDTILDTKCYHMTNSARLRSYPRHG